MSESAMPAPLPPDQEKADKAEKALRKALAARGPLEPGDRYKAQINAMKNAQDLIELGDRKARFALVVMSVLNAVLIIVVARGGTALLPASPLAARIVQVEIAAYVVVTVFYVFEAIQALRPRGTLHPPHVKLPNEVTPGDSMRVLFHADIVLRDRAEYRGVWDHLRMDNLTTELADTLHTLGTITQAKYITLDRLYVGLMIMTGLLALILATLGLSALLG